MKKITIAAKLHPFSHEPGTRFMLPLTSFCIQVFPTRLMISDVEGMHASFWIDFTWTGPVEEFTAQLDLETKKLVVFGRPREGYIHYQLSRTPEGLVLRLNKAPSEGISISSTMCLSPRLHRGETLLLLEDSRLGAASVFTQEKLSLGSHKAQDLSLMRRRRDPKELLPHWLSMAQGLPVSLKSNREEGNYLPLAACQRLILEKKKQEVLPLLISFFLAAFEGGFVPRLQDTDYQGLFTEQRAHLSSSPTSVLPLLAESASCVRSLFYQEIGPAEVCILPCLPPQLHCGRLTGVIMGKGQVLDMEWSKKKLRRMSIQTSSAGALKLWLPSRISSCRVKTKREDYTTMSCSKEAPLSLSLIPDDRVELDRFQD